MLPPVKTALLVSLVAASLPGCGKVGCLSGTDEDCVVPSPCTAVGVACIGGETELFVLTDADPPPVGGPDALGATGDIVLRNDHVVAVFDALDHPHYIAPTGGSLLDLAPIEGQDGLRNVFQATGLLPGDGVVYTEVRTFDARDAKGIQYRGTLDGHPDIHVATRYEIRPCEEGIRVRTEVVNLEPDPYPLFLVDAFYWGGNENLPFTPIAGFDHPSFGLSDIVGAIRTVPWMAAAHSAAAATYGVTSCDRLSMDGFQSSEISALGPPKRILMPRDWEVYERFIAVGTGPSVSSAADVLLSVREQTLGAVSRTVSGRVVAEDGGVLGDPIRASLLLRDAEGPYDHVVPGVDGLWSARVPPGDYSIEVDAFGMPVTTVDVAVQGDTVVPDIEIPGTGELTLDATVDGEPDTLLVYVYPSDPATEATTASFYGVAPQCAPLLGNPWGPSPACNRVLVDGPTPIRLPDGTYDLYASAGPFSTIAHVAGVRVESGTAQTVPIDVRTLPVQPAGTLSADFHVHGRASFDSAIPDFDRVQTFLASRIEVVAATDHDVVNDYAEALDALGANERMRLLVGLETTGHILFPLVETTIYPKVIGHFNFWPVPFEPTEAWRGAPWDEVAEPGELFTRLREAGLPESGVIQLNHPWGGVQFGRDFAWPTAIGLDLTKPLPPTYDGTGQGLFLRTPEGAAYANADYDTQEVMNGSRNDAFLQYRAVWHYLLNQGVVRAGTANSDSHNLTDNVLGTPRNLVFTDVTLAAWDEERFDADVKAGRMTGTNGPVIEISTTDADGGTRTPSLETFAPAADGTLRVRVSAAPWIPVAEVRILVDGEVVETLRDLPVPADPLGTGGIVRLDTEIPLADLLPSGDAWIVVEAGAPLEPSGDLDCNGVPDTGDNDGNGTIDWRDVADLEQDPGVDCIDTVGPLKEPDPPEPGTLEFLFERVTPSGHPMSFTNPLLLDRDGGGYTRAAPSARSKGRVAR